MGSFLTSTLDLEAAPTRVGGAKGPDPAPLAKLRANARYLMSTGLWQSWSRVTETIAGLLLNWTAPLFELMLLAWIAAAANLEKRLQHIWGPVRIALGASAVLCLLVYRPVSGLLAMLIGSGPAIIDSLRCSGRHWPGSSR